ncbi:MAG: Holliday junction resolvase RuvX [Flavobacteriales bacterium TMED123]|nr:MAG: Holliday junction resolvase RuvX [Flavobacteriales bacterium TMED123]
MAKVIGIDYGKKRIGIAISDTTQIIASPLCTVHAHEIFTFLKDLFVKEEINCIVVGEPKNLDGSQTDSTKITADFVAKFTKNHPDISIKSVDERFTSKMAKQSILAAGTKKMKRRDKGVVDKVSAAIILQSFLDSK